jgi:hypothetical protein
MPEARLKSRLLHLGGLFPRAPRKKNYNDGQRQEQGLG